jgi:very-short-patch-repair endonuclease
MLRSEVDLAADEYDTTLPENITGLNLWLQKATALKDLLSNVKPSLFDEDLDSLKQELTPATRGFLVQLVSKVFSAKYRRAIGVVERQSLNPAAPVSELARFVDVAKRLKLSDELGGAGTAPTAPTRLNEIKVCLADVVTLVELISHHGATELDTLTLSELDDTITGLAASTSDLINLPQLDELKKQLVNSGIARFLDWFVKESIAEEDAANYLEYSWLRALLTESSITDRTIGGFNGPAQDRIVIDFADFDRQHIESGAQRVRRRWAENSVSIRNAHPDQSATVRHQARLKRGHLPVRELISRAPDVVGALKPCWVMSPLAVAETLPPGNHFDVVMFDEASQILPADAILSLLQADQAIVVGDPKQLPPTVFFQSSDEGSDEEDEEDGINDESLQEAQQFALTRDLESILDVMQAILPTSMGSQVLEWHYRSEDERLIAFSNWHPSLYAGQLTTFPGALGGDRVSHELIPYREHSGPLSSYSPEVDRVVEMVMEHATNRPEETLGVITMGVKHRDRVQELLRLKRRDRADLDEFFSETQSEPFFVKNLENVQGDERDAVILSMGYSKGDGGRMRYNFGPVNQEGGERRLNVAITRARKRITVTSCFSGMEMDPERLNSEGPRMLKGYLEYAASGGTELPQMSAAKVELNAFEIDVRDTLVEAGIRVQSQYGVSGYWIDFAAMHPDRPEEPVLAIEADGATYHSSQSARDRDRLRQEHLERLGWTFFRIWSTDWFQNKESVMDRLRQAYAGAVKNRDRPISADKLGDGEFSPIAEASEDADIVKERSERPWVPYRQNIQDISPAALTRLIKWINSDGLLRTEEELIQEATRELGYSRRGSKIVESLTKAIRRAK